jgi:hypothetical protein
MERTEKDFSISVSSVASCEKVTVTIEGRVSRIEWQKKPKEERRKVYFSHTPLSVIVIRAKN